MGFKLRGGRKIPESKWSLSDDDSCWTSVSDDLHGGLVLQIVQEGSNGTIHATVRHIGIPKGGEDRVELHLETKSLPHIAIGQQWCRKASRRIIIKHDELVTTKSREYRALSRKSTPGSLTSGSVEDFGPSQRRTPKFRTRRRRP
jgi:hypothetical protein